MTAQWYTIFTKPHKEIQVADYLQSNDLEVYLPTLKGKPTNPRSAKIRSYFPRYLFVRTELASVGISALKWIPGAVGLVEFDYEPAIVPDLFVDTLKRRIDEIESAGGLHLHGLQQGDTVKIKNGPFTGFEAVFDVRLSGQDRVQVLLHWMGREMKVKLNANGIEKHRRRR